MHLLKLVDTMCKYDNDHDSNVDDTERTPFRFQTDGRTVGQTDERKSETSIPLQLRWRRLGKEIDRWPLDNSA